MMKRLAAAVLAAFVNLLASATPNTGADAVAALVVPAADDDGPDAPDCVEYRRAHGADPSRPVVLAMASAVCGEPIDAAWLVRHSGEPVVAVAAQVRADHVAMLDVMAAPAGRAGTTPQLDSAADLIEPLQRALAFCRDRGALKVVVNAGPSSPTGDVLRNVIHGHGFQLTRARRIEGTDVVELYTDLYWTDEPALVPPSARPTTTVLIAAA